MFTENDLVIYSKDNKIYSGGYEIKSEWLRNGDAAIINFNKEGNNCVSDILLNNGLGVPVSLLYLNDVINNKPIQTYKTTEVIEDSIYDKLLKECTEKKSEKKPEKKSEKKPKRNPKRNPKRKIQLDVSVKKK